jgi:hypothetical protein
MWRTGSAALAIFLLLSALPASPRADVAAAQLRWRSGEHGATPDVDPQVHRVLTGGCWQRGDAQGRYRLIVIEGGFEELFHLAYVQLMQVDLDRGQETITKTTLVTETEDPQYLVTLPDVTLAESTARQCGEVVFKGAILRRTRERVVSERRFELRVHPDGGYIWSETATPARSSEKSP